MPLACSEPSYLNIFIQPLLSDMYASVSSTPANALASLSLVLLFDVQMPSTAVAACIWVFLNLVLLPSWHAIMQLKSWLHFF